LSESYKICPICETPNHRNATVCTTCGTNLTHVAAVSKAKQTVNATRTDYDFRYGETDLLEESVSKRGNIYLIVSATIATVIIFAILGLLLTTDILWGCQCRTAACADNGHPTSNPQCCDCYSGTTNSHTHPYPCANIYTFCHANSWSLCPDDSAG
jgi:hypothetical protein